MEAITQLLELDVIQWIYTTFIVVAGIMAIVTLISKFASFVGKPLKWYTKRNEDHDLIGSTSSALSTLTEKHENDVGGIKAELAALTKMFVEKEIDDLRWELLDFASSLADEHRSYSKEQFDHVFSIYAKYERILEENNLTNGQVVTSMEVINEVYKAKLKNGF